MPEIKAPLVQARAWGELLFWSGTFSLAHDAGLICCLLLRTRGMCAA